MPTYSYQCGSCGHAFEAVQRMTEDPIKVCPSCGAEAVRRLINSANFILKGSGWYADLYSGGSNKKGESSGSKVGPTTPAASGDSASGSTPAASSGGDGGSSSSAPAAAPPPPPSTTKTS